MQAVDIARSPPAGWRATQSAQGCRGVTHVHHAQMKTRRRTATTETIGLHITELKQKPTTGRGEHMDKAQSKV